MKYIIPSDALVKTGYYDLNFPGIELFINSLSEINFQTAAEFWLNQLTEKEKRLVIYLPHKERYFIYKLHEIEFICVNENQIYVQVANGFFKLPWTIHNAIQYTSVTEAGSLMKIRFTLYASRELFLRLTCNSKEMVLRKNAKRN